MSNVVDLQSRRAPPHLFDLLRDTLCNELGMRPRDDAARAMMGRALRKALDAAEFNGFTLQPLAIPVALPQIGDATCDECGAPGGVHQGTCKTAAEHNSIEDQRGEDE